uniref:Uncharacterized protein n=1 Tax=Romanomermis culicivorax TaxID=13658 RepID=A0A915JQT8_ROMCU
SISANLSAFVILEDGTQVHTELATSGPFLVAAVLQLSRIAPITVETATPVQFVLMATMILAIPTATTMIDINKTSVTTVIINETTDLPPTLANDAAIEKKLLYSNVCFVFINLV